MKRLISTLAFLALIVAIVLYASGAFSGERVSPDEHVAPPTPAPPPAKTVAAEEFEAPVYEDAVGTIESRTKVSVSAQVTARVRRVEAEAGGTVEAGTDILWLDDRDMQAHKAQAVEGVVLAKAAHDHAVQAKVRAEAVLSQARKGYERVKGLVEARAATPEQFEQGEAAWLQATAGVAEAEAAIAVAAARVQQAEEALAETDVLLDYATIQAPLTGVVFMKNVEPGDLALPGKTLLEVLDPTKLRLVAQVREGLVGQITRGDELEVILPALDLPRRVVGRVAEVCPTADPTTRTFRVRIDLDPLPGLRPGMFGRLRIPMGERQVVRIPMAAVTRTGQLATVRVKVGERWERRMVTTGVALADGNIEVLSGLAPGEIVGYGETE